MTEMRKCQNYLCVNCPFKGVDCAIFTGQEGRNNTVKNSGLGNDPNTLISVTLSLGVKPTKPLTD